MIAGHEPAQTAAAEWDALCDRCGTPPFARPGWHAAWTSAFAPGLTTVLTVRDGAGELRGVLPCLRNGTTLTLAANAHTPFASAVADGSDALAALADAFARMPAREVNAAPLRADDPLTAALGRSLRHRRAFTFDDALMRSPYLEFGDDPLHGLSRNMRKELKRGRRRLEEDGDLRLELTHGGPDAARGFADLVHIEDLGWKAETGTSIAREPGAHAFYDAVVRWAGDAGILWMVVLRSGDRPIAAELDLRHGDTVYSLKTGYDPDFAKSGPGHVMLAELLLHGVQQGVHRYEMLGADEPYKMRWTATTHDVRRVRAFRPSPAGVARLGRVRVVPALRRRVAARVAARSRDRR